jgi:hypothetical protein
MALARTCSECGTSLAGRAPQTKTCSPEHRQQRARRVRALTRAEQRDEATRNHTPPEIAEIMAVVANPATRNNTLKRVVEQELRPIIRSAMTEELLRAIQDMMNLTPRAVAAIHEDLESDDAVIRQRAYTLLIKYTIGHPALLHGDDTSDSKQININFAALPRPDEIPPDAEIVEEVRVCDLCSEPKPESEFVSGSDRCVACFERWQQEIEGQFA